MSTTATKKQLVDFLWEWTSNLGDWSKILVDYIVRKEDSLTDQERKEIFDYFLQSIGFKRNLPPLNITKPTYCANPKEIYLTSLSNVKGVNKLADNQIVEFSKNLTVVYGENASGKTGYGRILKSLGFSYEIENIIYSDINSSQVQQTATIEYTEEGIKKSFNWDGNSSNEELQTISFFNNDCVNISLCDDRDLIVSPVGFHLFNLITSELTSLSKMLNQAINNLPIKVSWTEQLTPRTPQYCFIQDLSANSVESKLIALSTFTCIEEKEITDSEIQLKNLNKALIEKEISLIRLQIAELNNIISKIQDAEKYLNKSKLDEMKRCNLKVEELENTSRMGLKDIAGSINIESYQSPEFSNFLRSAENYIKILQTADYPNSKNEICIYCRQTLNEEGKVLLASYRKLYNDTTQTQIESIKKIKENIIAKAKTVDSALVFHQAVFGTDVDSNILQPNKILEYNKIINEIKLLFTTDRIDDKTIFDFDYSVYINFLTDKKVQLENDLLEKTNLFQQINPTEIALKTKLNELRDRKFLSTKIEDVKEVIKNKKIVAKLTANASSFNTHSISRKTSEAREELVGQNFALKFKEELKLLRKSQINIELTFGTIKGQSKIQQKMKSKYFLKEILSDGEQKAIALAEFLTELQLDKSCSPVIFDDPVTSLDHHIIDDVARRLIKLSKERQVVIFTHSVLLFNSILYFSKQPPYKDLNYKMYNSKKEFGKCGVITKVDEEINSVTFFIKRVEIILNNTSQNRPESEIASEGYGFLRSAIELCVENEILKAVKRYQRNVVLTKFVEVDGDLINQYKAKLNEIFEHCCCYITGHSNPTIINNNPTLNELEDDFNSFKEIRNKFINKIKK